jgi:hypothetical protein
MDFIKQRGTLYKGISAIEKYFMKYRVRLSQNHARERIVNKFWDRLGSFPKSG